MFWIILVMAVLAVVVLAALANDSQAAGSREGLAMTPSVFTRGGESGGPRAVTGGWVPAGETVRVAGFQLPGGMLYVGGGRTPVNRSMGRHEPAQIDPHLPVDARSPDALGVEMRYWPSYAEMSPASRAAYLGWLAGGRQDPDAYIGYVFLFFYGLERRVLYDEKSGQVEFTELDAIRAETRRLLAIYGQNRSFRRYASTFADACFLLRRRFDIEMLEPPAEGRGGYELPFSVRLVLAKLAVEGRPLPAEWAFSWWLTSPEASRRTPAQRCPEEFRELFLLRYREKFGSGQPVRKRDENLVLQYHPASATFGGAVTITTTLPDVDAAGPQLEALKALAERCTQELEPYSRWVGRTGEKNSPPAIALLPPELAAGRGDEATRELSAWLEQRLGGEPVAPIVAADLLARWPCKIAAAPTRRELEALSDFLVSCGIGIEPDAALGGASLARQRSAVLFRLPERQRSKPAPAFEGAAALLQLAAMVSAADGEVKVEEERHLLEHVERSLDLSADDRLRLEARFRYLSADPPTLAKVKKGLETLPAADQRPLAQFLVSLAGADGHLHPSEIKLLGKLYPLLGLDAQSVYADIHQLASGGDDPISIRPAAPAPGYAIPRPPSAAAAAPRGVELDLDKVRARLAETERVSHLLGQIFVDEEDKVAAPRPAPPAAAEGSRVAGLDGAHSALLLALAERSAWPRLEAERLAAGLGLLPDGALETINEAAFEACGAALFEGEEILEIDREVLGEMLA